MWATSAASRTNVPGSRAGHHPAPLLKLVHGLEMDEAEGMVEEMGGRKREQDQPGADPNALKRRLHEAGRSCLGGRFVQQMSPG